MQLALKRTESTAKVLSDSIVRDISKQTKKVLSDSAEAVQDEKEEFDPEKILGKPLEECTRQDLVDKIEVLESLLTEERMLNQGLQHSQQVVIDHLMETNEGLLKFFQMKKILPKNQPKQTM